VAHHYQRWRRASAGGRDRAERGDPDLDTPAAVVERAVGQLRGGDTHYVPAAGRPALRQAIAAHTRRRCGQPVGADNVVYFAGRTERAVRVFLCLAGPGTRS